jgi:hypothetical protein
VTHAVVALAAAPDAAVTARLLAAGEAAGLTLLRIIARSEIGDGPRWLAAAILAEDMAPRPEAP